MLSVRAYQPVFVCTFSVVYADSIETGYSPEGTALQLVLKTINSAQQEIPADGLFLYLTRSRRRLSGQSGVASM